MTRTDDALEELLRRGDPLPSGTELDRELASSAARTSGAIDLARRSPAGARASTTRARASTDGASTTGPIVAAHAVYAAPWGPIHLASSERGLAAVSLRQPEASFIAEATRRLGGRIVPVADPKVPDAWRRTLERTIDELDEYFAGRRTSFDLPVDLTGLSDWDRSVLSGAARLRFGEVTSYGRLARMIGRPGAARAVGGALGRNPVPIVVPCHRILAGDGTLGGYGGGWTGAREDMLAIKTALLTCEGVRVPTATLVG